MDTFLHDFAYQWGGAERVFASIAALQENAPLVIVGADRPLVESHMPDRLLHILYPYLRSNRAARLAVPALSHAIPRRPPLGGRVTASSYALSRWVPVREPRAVYLHSPMRQIWHGRHLYMGGLGAQAIGLKILSRRIRQVDLAASNPDDQLLVPSDRIRILAENLYGSTNVQVCPPPLSDDAFLDVEEPVRFDLVWAGRIVEPIKRLGTLIELFTELPDRKLTVIGEGRDRRRLEKLAPANVEFVGWKSSHGVSAIIRGCQALLLPSMEDFGLIGAEALAAGTPVVVTKDAGISEWIVAGHNGLILGADAREWVSALAGLDRSQFASREQIRKSAQAFRRQEFEDRWLKVWGELGWLM